MEIEVAPGAFINAFTFEGSVPGPMIVLHQNDYLELTLVNPQTNLLTHNIDFHAATGALGGGELTNVAPGQEVVIPFKATKPRVFVYHCAPREQMIPWHVVFNGKVGGLIGEYALKSKFGERVLLLHSQAKSAIISAFNRRTWRLRLGTGKSGRSSINWIGKLGG